MEAKQNKISFVIPCYNSEHTIVNVVDEIMNSVRAHDEYEIILVNDGSSDGTWDILRSLAKESDNIKTIDLVMNKGQQNAIMAGFRHVSGDIIVCLDDDGQTPANEMYALIDKLDDNTDLVFADYPKKKESWFRLLGGKFTRWTDRKMLGTPEGVTGNSFFACKRMILDDVIRYENPYVYLYGLLVRTTNRIANARVNHRDRQYGESGYSLQKLLSLWLNGFTSFSVKPLRIASIIGFICSICGFLYGIYTVVHKLVTPDIAVGYSSIIAVILFIGGITMLMMGMLGEYVGRIYISLNQASQYIIRETLNFDHDSFTKE